MKRNYAFIYKTKLRIITQTIPQNNNLGKYAGPIICKDHIKETKQITGERYTQKVQKNSLWNILNIKQYIK